MSELVEIFEGSYPEYTEEDRFKETEAFKQVCGSCINFSSYLAEAGFCKLNNLKLCDPKAMIDLWDNRCDKWVYKYE
mgnify:CR=1 FL=1